MKPQSHSSERSVLPSASLRLRRQSELTGVNRDEREKVNDAQWEINLQVSQEVSQEMG